MPCVFDGASLSSIMPIFKVKRQRKVVFLSLQQVSKVVGLTPDYIKKLEREGRFPKRHSPIGRARWSKLKVYHWLNRWNIRSCRDRRRQERNMK